MKQLIANFILRSRLTHSKCGNSSASSTIAGLTITLKLERWKNFKVRSEWWF